MVPEFQLTSEESILVENTSWILTKHRVIGKVYGLFGVLSDIYKGIQAEYAPFVSEEVTSVSPKIYKGEQYRQLPYVMMDYPRYFKQEDTFAIRSFFWWGNSFSIHLLLGGKYKEMYEANIQKHILEGNVDHWFVGVSIDPWQHHFELDNYMSVTDIKTKKAFPTTGNYLKLARWHSLSEWKAAPTFYTSSFIQLLKVLT